MTHPSEVVLERLFVDDLPADARQETARHLAGCAECQAALREVEQEFVRARPADQFMAELARRRKAQGRRRRLAWGGGGLAVTLAAAAALFVLHVPPPDRVQLKGAGMMLHRNRAGVPSLLHRGDSVRAGDAVSVVVTLAQENPVNLWLVDQHGRIDRMLPDGPLRLAAGEHLLPGSAIVEAPCVSGWVVLGLGDRAVAAAEARLRVALRSGADFASAGFLTLPLRCE